MGSDESTARRRRSEFALELLQEAVYRSRGAQAGAGVLRAPGKAPEKASGNCGLGERAVVVLDLTPRAEAAFDGLFPDGLAPAALAAVRDVLAAWVRRQDALDRRRNHFLKDFRHRNGAERTRYSSEVAREYDEGLAAINREVASEREAAAQELLGATSRSEP